MSLTDEQARFGPFRAKSCEWTDKINGKKLEFCGGPLYKHSCYCEEHYNRAYYQPKSDEDVDLLVEKELKELPSQSIPMVLDEEEV